MGQKESLSEDAIGSINFGRARIPGVGPLKFISKVFVTVLISGSKRRVLMSFDF